MKKFRLLPLPIVALVLEILPIGAVCIFASAQERVRETFSYFDLLPFGYGDVAPLLTAVLTCVTLLLAVIAVKKQALAKGVFAVSLIAAVVSLLPLIHGVSYYSLAGCLITAMLAAECFLAVKSVKNP